MSIIGQRINYTGNLGTVLYEGKVTSGDTIWLGVQWDDPSRGKHNGDFKGIKFFSPTVKNSGSFVKRNSPLLHYGQSFVDALLKKYQEKDTSAPNTEPIVWGKVVETVGFEKIEKKQSQISDLVEVGLDLQNISKAYSEGDKSMKKIRELCPNITELNLSQNLFSQWKDVFDIIGELEHLDVLFLNKNKISPLTTTIDNNDNTMNTNINNNENHFKSINNENNTNTTSNSINNSNNYINNTNNNNYNGFSVKTLSLNSCIEEWKHVLPLEKYFPKLENLSLGFNELTTLLPSPEPHQFAHLKSINLEGNKLSNWNEIEMTLGDLPTLESLKINNNKFSTITYTEGKFQHLQVLNINDNEIATWDMVQILDKFPALNELRLKRNPINDTVKTLENFRVHVIGRLGKLIQFNGSAVSKVDRDDCERYYLNLAFQEKSEVKEDNSVLTEEEFNKRHPRFLTLQEHHGLVLKDNSHQVQTLGSSLLQLQITCPQRTKKIAKKKLPPETTILTLKGIIQRLFKVPILSQSLYIIEENKKVEKENASSTSLSGPNHTQQTPQAMDTNPDHMDNSKVGSGGSLPILTIQNNSTLLNENILPIFTGNQDYSNNEKKTTNDTVFEMDDDIKTLSHYNITKNDIILVKIKK